MLKHPTSSVFLFTQGNGGWRIGLIHHPRLHRWMLPGGHLEPNENPAEAALREVNEETGFTAQLITTHTDGLTNAVPGVPVPVWIAEQQVPAEARHPHPHVHVDHLYLAVTTLHEPVAAAELRFGWFARDDLNQLGMFDDSRRGAHLLFGRIDTLTATRSRLVKTEFVASTHAGDDG
jgi:8-oxo-dGTP pyrophosphatase MutT (NUDIX family)